jgi:ubiquinol-cytochrome c reductase cytochrome c1 subunit
MRRALLCLLLCAAPWLAATATQAPALDRAEIQLADQAAVKRGAKLFVEYCHSCHAAAFMRYNRIGQDLGMTDEEVAAELVYTGRKVGDTMEVALDPEDAKRWFSTAPPDLSVVARARGVDWLYTYLRAFYRDDARPWGVNNRVFKDVAMPHVLADLQGVQEPVWDTVTHPDGRTEQVMTGLTLTTPGKLTPAQYDATVRDLVTFLAYLGEPSKLQRQAVGKWVLLYLLVFLILIYLLKREYWKDVH